MSFYCISCRNDGWHYVLAPSATSARCQRICGSHHQGNQWSHWQQPLETHPMQRDTRRLGSCALSMGIAAQARSHNEEGHKAQGQAQPSRLEAGIWQELLQYLRACYTWFAIQLLIVFGLCYGLSTSSHCEDMYMELPTGIHTKHGNSKDHVLKLLANIYGQKQAGCVRNNHLVTKLWEINFKQSHINDCIFYWDDVIIINCVINYDILLCVPQTRSSFLLHQGGTAKAWALSIGFSISGKVP